MLDILKKKDKSQKGKEVKTKMNDSERKLEKLLSQKQSIELELEELKSYKNEKGALLPFEKIELLEKELELLKIKERVALKKIENKRKEKGSSQDLDKICVQIREAIEEKEEEIIATENMGRTTRLNFNGETLNRDPRTDIKKEIEKKKHYNIIVDLLDKRLKMFKVLERNRKNLMNHTLKENKVWFNDKLISINDRRIKDVKELKKRFTKKSNTDYQNQLNVINAELEEIRAELISRNEYTI